MIDHLLIFTGGLLGSAHCIGMCGPFVLALGALPSAKHRRLRHVTYGMGRVFTYAVGGTVAGGLGLQLDHSLATAQLGQGLLSAIAGLVLVLQGLFALGMPWPAALSLTQGCQFGGLLGAMLKATRLRSFFLAGMVNGLVPCGLVYAYLTAAMASAGPLDGGLLMLCFGLGTMPMMILVGMGSGWVSHRFRQRLYLLAAICIVATGLMMAWRGANALCAAYEPSTPVCPACAGD